MGLVQDLYNEFGKLVNKDNIYESRVNNRTMLQCKYESEEDKTYTVLFCIPDNSNKVEIYIRKQIEIKKNTLKKLNDLNVNYTGATFCVDKSDILSVKTLSISNGDPSLIILDMICLLNLAKETFKNFT